MSEINISNVYCILNTQTNRKYIGSTTRFTSRKRQHRWELSHNKHPSKPMQEDYNLYGEDSFQFFVLEDVKTFERDELFAREQYWMDLYKPEYNTNPLAGNYFHESAYTPKAKEKHASKMRGRKRTQKEKEKTSESLLKYYSIQENRDKQKWKEGQREYFSKMFTGEGNPNWGKHRTTESKKKSHDSGSKILYTFKSPTGEEITTKGLMTSAESELGIPYGAARNLYRGLTQSHNGWTFVKSEKIG